ncbi:MAG: hypothetical protein Q7I91_01870, partial [Moraxellaceae bacterium]|nr:hypothetical protein [Moraxellaceae bacterium]
TIRQSSSAETRYRYDEQGRLIGMFVPSGNKHLVGIANGSYNYTTANSGRVDTLTYDYDEVGNRRRTVFNTTNQDNTTVNKERWFTYDKEDRMLQGDMIMEDGKLYYWAYANGETSGYRNYYNAAGQVIFTYQFNNYGTTTLNGVTYLNSPIYEVLSYAYDDQNRLTSIDSRYRAYHQPNGQAAQWFTPDTVKQTTFTGGAVVTNSSKIRMRSTYDSNGNLQANSVRTYKLNGTLDSVSDSTWSYRGDGKAVYQSSSEQKGSVLTTQKIFFNDVGDIDSQGNQLKYRMEYKSGSTAFTNTYTKTYAAFDGYKELTTTVTRPGMTTGVTTHSYTERGELKQVSATGGTSFTRQLANNREGLIT